MTIFYINNILITYEIRFYYNLSGDGDLDEDLSRGE
jgi:hypothetical protein